MKLKSSALSALMLLFIFFGTAIAAGKLWVSSTGAKLKADKAATSATVESLSVGAELKVISEDGSWYNVQSPSGKKGWIYRGKISSQPPTTSEKGGGSLTGVLPGSSIQASTADTSRSIRGLSPAAEEYAVNTGTPAAHKQALDRILAYRVTDKEIEDFLKEGKVGEYGQ